MATNWPTPQGNSLVRVIDDRYRLIQLLGSGSLGEVYLATALKITPPRLVAIKLMHTELLTEPESCQEFRQEALLLRRLNHPNIQHLVDFEIRPDLAYLVTDYAANGSLENLLCPDPDQPPVPLTLDKIDSLFEQITSALGYLHQQRLVHRDLKPANILINQTGQALLADFSLTTFLNSQVPTSLIKAAAWGTPLYAAPEVWNDQTGKASDIYALGAILFQLLTGQPPFNGTLEELEEQHLSAPVPTLGEVAPGLVFPPEMDKVIAAAMAKDPSQRINTAPELYRRYKAALASAAYKPEQNKKPSASRLTNNYSSQYFNWEGSSSAATGTGRELTSFNTRAKKSPGLRLISVLVIFTFVIVIILLNLGGSKPAANSGTFVTARPSLPTTNPVISTTKPTVEQYSPGADNAIVINQAHQGRVTSISWFPIGSVGFYSGSTDQNIRIWSLSTGQAKLNGTALKEPYTVKALAISPDGSILATALGDNTVVLTSRKIFYPVTIKGHTGSVNTLAWSPDGKILASASADMTARLWDVIGNPKSSLTGHAGSVNTLAWSPDGKTLATGSSDATIKIWSTDSTLITTIISQEGPVSVLAWSSDGKTIASASNNGKIELWNNDGHLKSTLKGHVGSVTGLDWSHDGKVLASASEDNTIRLWKSDGEFISSLNGHASGVSCLAWSLDDKFLVSGDSSGTIRVWKSNPKWF